MWHYTPPLDDMHFVIRDVLKAPSSWADIPALAEVDFDLAQAVLEQGGRFCTDILAPANAAGDLEGCTIDDGKVQTPSAFPGVYKQFVEQGWPALACVPEWGGQGLPQLLNTAIYEMMAASNHAWIMYPGLQHGAYESIKTHASEALCQRYLPGIVSGELLATMCLSEPQAGSDLSLIRTRAEPVADELDGAVEVSGSKIWISGGDHDLTENIVHLVLARLPDAPPGNKGLSLVLVPKLLPDGARNPVFADSIEKKMGLKGSATCAMRFDRARGWIIGQPNRGLSAMFVMMNAARLHVSLQGVGHLEAASQNAFRYAHERQQMRTLRRSPAQREHAADSIAHHPAIRRKILRLQALTEGGRVMAYYGAMLLDIHEHHPDPQQRSDASSMAALLTPVLKAFLTSIGHHGADDALQVWGGYGFTHDFGIEQTVRDSRVPMIYEGTNEIQAIDLLTRKVMADNGVVLERLLTQMRSDCDALAGDAIDESIQHKLSEQIERLERATQIIMERSAERSESDPEYALGLADDYLVLFGYTLMAWGWALSLNALDHSQSGPTFRENKARVMRFGLEWVLAECLPAVQRIEAANITLPQLASL